MRYTSKQEIEDLVKALFAISLAFAIVINGFSFSLNFIAGLIVSIFTVGIGFVVHELAHKVMAQRYGYMAEFRSSDTMLLLAILMSFTGFVFAAPGGVMISGYPTNKQRAKISAAGVGANLVVACLFLTLILSPFRFLSLISRYGLYINSWLAFFNLIPFGNFDGRKILAWNKPIYFTQAATALILNGAYWLL